MRRVMVCGLAMSLGGAALGQVAPPPPGPPAPRPVYERPAEAPRVAPGSRMPGQQGGINPREIEHEPLERYDADGRLIPLTKVSDVAAFDNNPLLDAASRRRAEAAAAARQREMELIAIAHSDAAFEVDNGIMDELSILDRDRIEMIRTLIQPLTTPSPYGAYMIEAGALSPQQAAMNDYIAQVYRTRQLEQARADSLAAGEEMPAEAILRVALKQQLEETMFAYRHLLRLAGGLGEEMLAEVENPPTGAVEAAKAAGAAGDSEARLEAVRRVLRELPLDQHAAVLSVAQRSQADN
ncbi:MAG: hypothetical protein EA378_06240 [Phycisphaerales bacterium]|nr:MAG: hypothetical protein EA378_06240 [Phycisphaerales bacterium]